MKPKTKIGEFVMVLGYFLCIGCGAALFFLPSELPGLAYTLGAILVFTGIFGPIYYVFTGEFPISTADF